MPILEAMLGEPQEAGIARVTMTVGYPCELMQTFFDDGKRLGIQSDYVFEKRPLGTVARLSLVPSWARETAF